MVSVSRRRALGSLAAFAAIPLLRPARLLADAIAPPTRLITMFSPVGTVHDAWAPSGSETAFTLSPILAPLEPYKSKLLVLDGVDMTSAMTLTKGEGHMRGMCHLWTGVEVLDGPFHDSTSDNAGFAGGISVDQRIASAVSTGLPFRSLEFGVQVRSLDPWSRMSYTGPNQPRDPMVDPLAAFDRVFAAAMTSTPTTPTSTGPTPEQLALERLRAQRRSVLDYVHTELVSLGQRVSASDRARLDAHLTSVRELELQLQPSTTTGATGTTTTMTATACTRPPRPSGTFDNNNDRHHPAIGRAMIDVMVAALACGLTRVASLQWAFSRSQIQIFWLGADRTHHGLSHEDTTPASRDLLIKTNKWYAEQMAYLLGKMQAVNEGTGTMLDHSLVVWGNELGRGMPHTYNSIPFVMAGGANGYFRTGRYLRYTAQPHNRLLVSMCNAFGINTSTFGDARFCTGGALPNLR